MIEKYFSDELRKKYPTWNVSEDFYEAKDKIIAVYSESGESTDPDNETNPLRPSYMIWLSGTDWEAVKKMSYEIYKMFHNKRNFAVTNYDGVTFKVNMIVAEQTPNRIGVEDRMLQYSINFNTHIREVI
jgi:hypothetical protein